MQREGTKQTVVLTHLQPPVRFYSGLDVYSSQWTGWMCVADSSLRPCRAAVHGSGVVTLEKRKTLQPPYRSTGSWVGLRSL
jgi:hypothetical protein